MQSRMKNSKVIISALEIMLFYFFLIKMLLENITYKTGFKYGGNFVYTISPHF